MHFLIPTLALLLAAGQSPAPPCPLGPVVEVEEDVYRYEPANNGAGPMWCHGSTCLARIGEDLFASGLETLKDFQPLNNCRWALYQRTAAGWQLQQADKTGRTREPCPLAAFADGRLFLSANPTLAPPNARAGPARPEILQFSAADAKAPFQTILPAWEGSPAFSEHSYRSFAADGPNRELILLQNIGHTHAEWALRDKEGKWAARGKLVWPWGADYEKPEPIRLCYPNVLLANRAVHFCGVSDIVEPNREWRAFKKQLTGRDWDYDFRRLFYTWTPDVATGKFRPWLELASREKTCGWIFPGDLWVGPDGEAASDASMRSSAVHVLWSERAIDERLRPKFFPHAKQSHALNYAVLRDGKVVLRRTLLEAKEGESREIPSAGRFQVAPENRLFVVYYVSGADAAGKPVSENRMLEILPDATPSTSVRLPLKHPMNSFFTATPRAGSPPSKTLDLLGSRVDGATTISYARIQLW